MQINITGHQMNVTPALRDYLNSKMDRIVRHFDNLTDVHFILSVDKLEHKAEGTLNTAGKTLFADASAEDMYAAIDMLSDKLDRQVRKHKEKLTNHHRGDNRDAAVG